MIGLGSLKGFLRGSIQLKIQLNQFHELKYEIKNKVNFQNNWTTKTQI